MERKNKNHGCLWNQGTYKKNAMEVYESRDRTDKRIWKAMKVCIILFLSIVSYVFDMDILLAALKKTGVTDDVINCDKTEYSSHTLDVVVDGTNKN